MESKIKSWVDEIKTLSNIAKRQPHAAYAAYYTHGLYSKWSYVLRVTDLEGYYLSELPNPNPNPNPDWSESSWGGSP